VSPVLFLLKGYQMQSVKQSTGNRKRGRRGRQLKADRKVSAAFECSKLEKQVRLELVDASQSVMIHAAVKKILWEVGVIIEHKPTYKKLLNIKDCWQDEQGYMHLPEHLIDQTISTVPEKIVLYDHDGNVKVDTSSSMASYCPGHNCVRILDYRNNELRPCSLDDIRDTAKLCEQLPNLDMVCSLGYPSEVPPEDEVIETVRAMYENCTKPAALLAHDEIIQERMLNLIADMTGGWQRMADKPVCLELMGPISPLKLPEEFCLRLINCARWGIPAVCYPATFPGMSCPISNAGAIAQSSAEAIAGMVIHQMESPGAPVMSGSAILPMDLRQANLAYGSPEYMMAGLGASDYFGSIGIPAWIGAGCSDSHQFDTQAAAEVGANLAIAALASTPFVHNLGFLSGGRTGSIQLLTLCDELIGWSSKMATGVEVTVDSIAAEVVLRSAKNNDFLTDQHTQDRFMTENWYPGLCERSDADAWLEAGAQDMTERVNQRIREILN
jgi:trimethylamine--corrinoid protein Co-methyltransferase|tara:strand:+ start:2480 stop:3973 length:1494 start_codon:yes stop_codon:yes gene_type:complete